MKLETQLKVYGWRSFDFDYSKSGLNHDALAAHALIAAMDWFEKTARHGHVAVVTTSLIKKRADEIMIEWGVA